MSNELNNIINNLAEDIIDVYKIQIPIKNMEDVVAALGGCIEENKAIVATSDSNVMKQGDGFVIYVSAYLAPERKYFAIAQELGHLFLHMGYTISPLLWSKQKNMAYYISKSPLEEYQANEFAMALLMPKFEYNNILDKYTTGDEVETGKIAEYFGVSVSAASARGKNLGYLK